MVNLCKHRTRIVKEGTTRVGQFDAARLAAEQLGIDFAFDRPDLPAERRWLQAKSLRSPSDVAFLCDRNDVAKLPQVHRRYLKGNDDAPDLS